MTKRKPERPPIPREAVKDLTDAAHLILTLLEGGQVADIQIELIRTNDETTKQLARIRQGLLRIAEALDDAE